MEKQERTTVGRNQVKTPAARQGLRIDRRARGSLTGHFRGTSPLARDKVVSLSSARRCTSRPLNRPANVISSGGRGLARR